MKGAGTGIITSFYKEVAEINEFHWQEEKVFFFFWLHLGLWKFLVQGSNLHHSSNLS